jgi:hypothetical protein
VLDLTKLFFGSLPFAEPDFTKLNWAMFGCNCALPRFATLVYAMLISATFGCNFAVLCYASLVFAPLYFAMVSSALLCYFISSILYLP